MKKTALILAFLACFINYHGFADPEPSRLTPVIPQIVEFISKNYGDSTNLKFYISKPFKLKEINPKKTADTENININGDEIIINSAGPANENIIEFSDKSEGKLAGPPGPDGREININFKEQDKQDKILVFRRNGQQNRYELFAIKVGNRHYQLLFSEPILLYVSGQNNQEREIEVKVIPGNAVFHDIQPPRYDYAGKQPRQDDYSHNVNYGVNSGRYAAPSRNIMDIGSIRPEDVIAYAKSRNPALSYRDIAVINEYFKEAADEGVNVDIAIAQMLHWTNSFNNRERVNTCNYGGLSNIADFNGRFPRFLSDGVTEGVRAHIQHLKAYAKEFPRRGENSIVDPRFGLAYNRGFRGITFDQLYGKWSENMSYGRNIDNILSGLYRFSGMR
jgi:hypothetical protein